MNDGGSMRIEAAAVYLGPSGSGSVQQGVGVERWSGGQWEAAYLILFIIL